MKFSVFNDVFKRYGYRRCRGFYYNRCVSPLGATAFFVIQKDVKNGTFSIRALVLPNQYGKKVNFEKTFAVARLNPVLAPKNVKESYQYKNISEEELQNNIETICSILEEYVLPLFQSFPFLTNKSYWDSYICPEFEELSGEQIEKMCQEDLIYNIALSEIVHQKNYHKAWLLMQRLHKYKKGKLLLKEKKLYRILSQYQSLGDLALMKHGDTLETLICEETFKFAIENNL